MTDGDIHSLLGDDGIARIVGAFYAKVKSDDILRPLYPEADLTAAEHRLRDFLIQRFGGPAHYSAKRGHPRLRMRHAPFKIDLAARNRWMELMESAMRETELPEDVVSILRKYFADTATFMMNHPG